MQLNIVKLGTLSSHKVFYQNK